MFKKDLPFEAVKAEFSDDQSKFIQIDGVEAHYKDEGEGKPILLLHDLNTSLREWDDLADYLSTDYRVLRIDFPGFGLSTYNENFNGELDSFIYFIKKFIAALRLDHIMIGGVGWGADIAWHYTTLSPYLVEKLILINPIDHSNHHPLFYQKMSKHWLGSLFYRWSGSKKLVKNRLKKWFYQADLVNQKRIDYYQTFLLKEGQRKTFITTNKAKHRNRHDRLVKITMPTLLIVSDELGKNPIEKNLPKAQILHYKKVNLYPMIELPDQTSQDVLKFLNR